MKKTLGISISILVAVGSVVLAGCATHSTALMESAPAPDSPTIEARVSRLCGADAALKKFKILVNTFQGTVMLDGVVDTEEQRQQATKLVWTVSGVRGVENNLFLPGENLLQP